MYELNKYIQQASDMSTPSRVEGLKAVFYFEGADLPAQVWAEAAEPIRDAATVRRRAAWWSRQSISGWRLSSPRLSPAGRSVSLSVRSETNLWTEPGWRARVRARWSDVATFGVCGGGRVRGFSSWWPEGGQTDSCLCAGNHAVQSHSPTGPPQGRTDGLPPQLEQQVGACGRGLRLSNEVL